MVSYVPDDMTESPSDDRATKRIAQVENLVVATQIFIIFTPIWGKIPILTNIFQMG